jgi:PadR family transcriptional regulator PadR
MGGDGLLGAFEEQVLLAVTRCGANAYGMTVRREIEERTGRDVAIGAVYATLTRLEQKGWVASTLRESGDAARRGRARRFFALLPEGADALREALGQRRSMWEGLDPSKLVEGGAP